MNGTLDRTFATAVERELAAIGTRRSRLQRHQRRTRAAALSIGSFALVGALTGAAVVVSALPGETSVTSFETTVTGTYTGTAEVELGTVPEGADRVILDITCSEGGRIEVSTKPGQGSTEGSAYWNCSDPVRENKTVHISDGALPHDGKTSVTVTADPGTPWTVVARYGSSETTEWGVNANGETYGVPNDNGMPDLSSAEATNGEIGYIRDTELMGFEGEGYIRVYESDGETVIGWFPIGDPAQLGEPPALDAE